MRGRISAILCLTARRHLEHRRARKRRRSRTKLRARADSAPMKADQDTHEVRWFNG